MKFSIASVLAALLATSMARPDRGYSAPSGEGFISGGGSSEGLSSGGGALPFGGCGEGEVRRADGSCAKAQVTRSIFLYAAPPAQQIQVGPAPHLPDPKVHNNFVFVRTPEITGGSRPVVVPPHQQKTLGYVLTKRPGVLDQEVIEIPATPTQPEVSFVNYAQGDNPELPGGIDLQEATSQAAEQEQVIDRGFSGLYGGYGGYGRYGVYGGGIERPTGDGIGSGGSPSGGGF